MNPSRVIQRRAESFMRHHAIQGYLRGLQEAALDDLDSELYEISSDHDKYCFLNFIKKSIEHGVK